MLARVRPVAYIAKCTCCIVLLAQCLLVTLFVAPCEHMLLQRLCQDGRLLELQGPKRPCPRNTFKLLRVGKLGPPAIPT